jgi:hypothetical protein
VENEPPDDGPIVRRPIVRQLVAFACHAPGLYLFYRERLTGALVRHNLVAIALTLVAMAVAWALAPAGYELWGPLGAWVVGHAAWGAYLALRLPHRRRA